MLMGGDPQRLAGRDGIGDGRMICAAMWLLLRFTEAEIGHGD
jgi:hypothetical protein